MDETLIFDISSDDKEGFDDSSTADNFDWISQLFDDTSLENDVNLYSFGDDGGDGGDDGEVVFIGETIPKPKKAKVSLNECVLDDDDDDCVVLDCDPDEKDKVEINYGDGDGVRLRTFNRLPCFCRSLIIILPDVMQIFSKSSCLWAHRCNLHSFDKTDYL